MFYVRYTTYLKYITHTLYKGLHKETTNTIFTYILHSSYSYTHIVGTLHNTPTWQSYIISHNLFCIFWAQGIQNTQNFLVYVFSSFFISIAPKYKRFPCIYKFFYHAHFNKIISRLCSMIVEPFV